MQQFQATYSSALTVTPSDTTPISCRGIYVGGAGDVTISSSASATPVTFKAPPIGTILPLELNQGRIMATGTTATLLVALA